MTVAIEESVLELCRQLLEDIKAYKGEWLKWEAYNRRPRMSYTDKWRRYLGIL